MNSFQSPISPSDLLVALHHIDVTKCDLKTVIKGKHCTHDGINILTNLYCSLFSYRIVFCREEHLHAGSTGCCDPIACRRESCTNSTDANRDADSLIVPTSRRIRNECFTTIDPEAGVETTKSMGRLYDVLPANDASKFPCTFPVTHSSAQGTVCSSPGSSERIATAHQFAK